MGGLNPVEGLSSGLPLSCVAWVLLTLRSRHAIHNVILCSIRIVLADRVSPLKLYRRMGDALKPPGGWMQGVTSFLNPGGELPTTSKECSLWEAFSSMETRLESIPGSPDQWRSRADQDAMLR